MCKNDDGDNDDDYNDDDDETTRIITCCECRKASRMSNLFVRSGERGGSVQSVARPQVTATTSRKHRIHRQVRSH